MTRVPVAVLIAAGLSAAFALINPVHDTDLFWQAKFGELMLERGRPVCTEPFYPDAEGRPIIPIYSLAQVYYAVTKRIGGWELIKLLDAVFWSLAFTLPALAAQKRYDPSRGWPAALAIVVGTIAASKFYMTRPQTFAMLGMGAFLAVILSDWSTRKKILVGAITLVVWQNLHPSAIVGGVAAGVLAAAGWLAVFFKRQPKPWCETILIPIAVVAMFATPAGSDILTIMRVNTDRVALFGVTEWLPLFNPANHGVRIPAVFGMSVTLLAVAFRWRRIGFGCIAVSLIFAGLTVWSHRFVVFFGIVAVPVMVQAFSRKLPLDRPIRFARAGHFIAMTVILGLAFVALRNERLPLWNAWFPFDAAAALEREHVRGPILTTTEWGGLLTDRGYPGWRVISDGRYFARTHDECRWYLAAINGEVPIEDVEARDRPVAYFLHPGQDKLARGLLATGRWRQLHADSFAIVIVRK